MVLSRVPQRWCWLTTASSEPSIVCVSAWQVIEIVADASDYHAPYVTEAQDVRDFLRFCEAFVSELDVHHSMEETIIFPRWREVTGDAQLMEANMEEHGAFHDGLVRLKEYTQTTEPVQYKSAALLAIMDSFMPALAQHLTAEVEAIMALQDHDGDKLLQIFREAVQTVARTATKDEQFPFVFSCNDVTFEGGKHHFPPVPWIVNFVVKWVFARKHRGIWRFSPSDMYGRPKPLEFGVDAQQR